MKTFQEQAAAAIEAGLMHEFFGWDSEAHDSSVNLEAIATLMGWRGCSDNPHKVTCAHHVTDETMLQLFQDNGERREGRIRTCWHWNGWHAEKWDNPEVGNGIYFYNPVCKTTAADAYEFLMQI